MGVVLKDGRYVTHYDSNGTVVATDNPKHIPQLSSKTESWYDIIMLLGNKIKELEERVADLENKQVDKEFEVDNG